MKVLFKLTESEKDDICAEMEIEHAGYYGQPHGARYGLGFTVYKDSTIHQETFTWTSSRGNTLTIKCAERVGNWATYDGTRNGLVRGGFLHRVVPHLRASQNRGDWRYVSTNEPDWLPLETERDHG